MLSVIIPAYNEGAQISKTNEVIDGLLSQEKIDHEIIFINDGSSDNTWDRLNEICGNSANTRAICFSRNFGKEAAMFAGLETAEGDCAVIIDCDLQHPPETIIQMYRLWEQGYEVVEGVKASRGKESIFHKLAARRFYSMMSKATGIDMARASDFKLLDRRVIDELIAMPERKVFFRALSSWVGFHSTQVEFDVREREQGESKWSLFSLIKYAINNVTSFSAAPMQIVTIIGCIFFVFTFFLGLQTLVKYILGKALGGFTTVIILQLLIGSITMISLGIIGYYLAKIYDEIKNRPRFIISRKLNGKKDENKEGQV